MSVEGRKVAMNPPGIPSPIRPYYSNCVKVAPGALLFLSGQVGMSADGKIPPDARSQTELAIQNLRVMLEANGATLDDLARVNVYVTDMRHFDEIAEVRLKYFAKNGPTSTIIEISKLALPGLLIEIDAIAVVPERR